MPILGCEFIVESDDTLHVRLKKRGGLTSKRVLSSKREGGGSTTFIPYHAKRVSRPPQTPYFVSGGVCFPTLQADYPRSGSLAIISAIFPPSPVHSQNKRHSKLILRCAELKLWAHVLILDDSFICGVEC